MILFLKFPLEDSLGGAELHTLRLALHFQEIGKKILLISSDKKLIKLFQDHNLPGEYLFIGWEPTSKWSIFLWPLTYLIARYKLKKALRKIQNIEAVFMQSLTEKLVLSNLSLVPSPDLGRETPLSRPGERLGERSNILWLEHKIPGRWLRLNPLKNKYLRLAKKVKIITVSNFAKKEFIKLGVADNNIQVIYPGVNNPPQSPLNLRGEAKGGYFTIGLLSRLHPEKGILDFLKHLALALKTHQDWHVLIAGEGPEKKKIEQFANSNDLEGQISMLGFVSDKTKFFSQISVFCYPTKAHESFGMAVLEAQANGIPVIASNIGALPEILDDFLVEKSGQWVQYLEILAGRRWREKTGQTARENSKRFSETRMLAEFDRLIQNL